MAIVVLKLPNVKRKTEEPTEAMSLLRRETFQRWGQVNKPVKDVHVRKVKVYRYQCCHCNRTFRHYPEGNTGADQTERLTSIRSVTLDIGVESSSQQLDFEWLESDGELHDHLAGCTS